MKRFVFFMLSVVATVTVTLLVLNLSLGDKQVDFRLPHRFQVASEQFPHTMSSLLGPALVSGNRVDESVNGEQIFPAMLNAINSATRSISFESYICWSGEIGRQFAVALAGKARSGVPVRVLLDWFGSEQLDPKSLEHVRAAGVQISRYNRPRWNTIGRLNNRTHRKLLIVDGRIGFTGGVGIADQWLGAMSTSLMSAYKKRPHTIMRAGALPAERVEAIRLAVIRRVEFRARDFAVFTSVHFSPFG